MASASPSMRVTPVLLPEPRELLHAERLVGKFLKPTPLLAADDWGGQRFGSRAWLKLETDQVTGSYKVRGVISWLAHLAPTVRARGVWTTARGRHALATAYACRALGAASRIEVPFLTPQTLRMRLEAFGAEVEELTNEDFEKALAAASDRTVPSGTVLCDPRATDPWTSAGSGGTVASEVLEQLPTVRRIVVPEEHGGLVVGLAAALLERGANVSLTAVRCGTNTGAPKFGVPGIRRAEVSQLQVNEAVSWGWESLGVSLDQGSAAALAHSPDISPNEEVVVVLSGSKGS